MGRKVLFEVIRGGVDREKKVERQRDTRINKGKWKNAFVCQRAWGKYL